MFEDRFQGVGSRVQGLDNVEGRGSECAGDTFPVRCSKVSELGVRVWVKGGGWRVEGERCRVQGVGCKV